MRRSKKRSIIFLCSVIFLFILASLGVLYIHRKTLFPYRYEPKKFTGNIFGKPNGKTDYQFPLKKPEFSAKVSSIQSPSLIQQAVTMYHSNGNKGSPVFQRSYYDDGFHGRVLTYHFASDSASFQQS